MNYSTELPEGFKTWNDLWQYFTSSYGYEKTHDQFLFNNNGVKYRYNADHIKAKCYDEIMELLKNVELDWNKDKFTIQPFYVLEDIEQLTKTKLFK